MDKYNLPEYKRARFAYSAQCAFEHFVGLLFGGSFLVKLLNSLGMSDSAIGIISSISTFAVLFQVIEIFLTNKIKNVKRTVMIWDTMSQLSFAIVYFIPFLNIGVNLKVAMVVAVIIFGYFSRYIIFSCYYKWANSYVSPDKLATYSAVKEMISLFTGMIVSLLAAYVFSRFEDRNMILAGFLFLGVVMIIINSCSFISYCFIKNAEIKPEEKTVKYKMSDVMNNTLLNKSFRNAIILIGLIQVSLGFAGSFMGTLMQVDFGYTVLHIQIFTILGHLARMAVSLPLGRYSDKKSYAKGIRMAVYILILSFVAGIFSCDKATWLVILYLIFSNMAQAGIYANFLNITYDYVKPEFIVPAMAIKNCVGGILGFGASLVGGAFLQFVQDNGNVLFGIKAYGQQFMSTIAVIILIGAVVFGKFVVEKQKRIS